MPKMIIIECSDEEADRMVEQLKNIIAEYEYHPYHGPGKVYEFGSLRIDQPKQEVTINGIRNPRIACRVPKPGFTRGFPPQRCVVSSRRRPR